MAMYIMAPFMASAVMAAPASLPPLTNTTTVGSGSESNTTADNSALIAQLETAATAVDRLALLPAHADHVYDFQNPPNSSAITMGKGGRTVKADRKTFPALVGTSLSSTLGFLGPCGFNTPHTHPRSAEFNLIVQGRLVTEFVAENGAPLIRNEISQYQATVFPQGALHTEYNPDCTPAVFAASFANEDPGVLQAAQSMFSLDADLIEAAFDSDFTFDGADINTFRSLIPANVALGVESCLQKCNIAKR